jgi:hypothetical protein
MYYIYVWACDNHCFAVLERRSRETRKSTNHCEDKNCTYVVPVDIGIFDPQGKKTSIVAIMVSPFLLLMSDEPGGITDVSLVLPCSSTSGFTGSLPRWTAQAQ